MKLVNNTLKGRLFDYSFVMPYIISYALVWIIFDGSSDYFLEILFTIVISYFLFEKIIHTEFTRYTITDHETTLIYSIFKERIYKTDEIREIIEIKNPHKKCRYFIIVLPDNYLTLKVPIYNIKYDGIADFLSSLK